jgi:hypothetical protein
LLAAAGLVACTAARARREATTAAAGAGTVLHEGAEEMQRLRATLNSLEAARASRNAALVRGAWREVLADGTKALAMRPPDDLRQVDVLVFLEGRANFGDAINAFGRAANGGGDAEVFEAARRLDLAFSAWWDAYRGLPASGDV